jgi:predicted transcriptional regulator
MTLRDVIAELLHGSEHDFPVVEDGRAVGILTRQDLMKALSNQGADRQVRDVMRTACPMIEETAMLDQAFQHMQEAECPLALVMEGQRLVGVLSLENVGELMMIATLTDGKVPSVATNHSRLQDIKA